MNRYFLLLAFGAPELLQQMSIGKHGNSNTLPFSLFTSMASESMDIDMNGSCDGIGRSDSRYGTEPYFTQFCSEFE
jgi:hypothetical protein